MTSYTGTTMTSDGSRHGHGPGAGGDGAEAEAEARPLTGIDAVLRAQRSYYPHDTELQLAVLTFLFAACNDATPRQCVRLARGHKVPVAILQNTIFFRSNALHCTATARILIPG